MILMRDSYIHHEHITGGQRKSAFSSPAVLPSRQRCLCSDGFCRKMKKHVSNHAPETLLFLDMGQMICGRPGEEINGWRAI